nr:alpha/beta-type small acid-soluble spore protein [Desulfoscipio gibsoniae]
MAKDLMALDKALPELMSKTAATGLVPRELQAYVAPALEEFRNEMATELGMDNYAYIDKGELPSRLNGKVGGGMTKKMVSFAEAVLAWNYKNRTMLNEAADKQPEMITE